MSVADAAKNAYDRYVPQCSGGAVVCTDIGDFEGTTFQIASYPLSLCALRGALANAISHGAEEIAAVKVGSCSKGEKSPRVCGTCLEFLSEFANGKCPISIYEGSEMINQFLLQDAFPLGLRETQFLRRRKFAVTPEQCEGIASAVSSFSPEDESFYRAAIEACKFCYAPVSNFPVGAAVRTDKGIFVGANVETTSLRAGLCAEGSALHNALAAGAKSVFDIAVVCWKSESFSSPCGGCRQMINEWPDCRVHSILVQHDTKTYRVDTHFISFLLPGAFSL